MFRLARLSMIASVLSLPLIGLPVASHADVEVSHFDWSTQGSSVRFHAQFHNPGPDNTGSVSGQMSSQPYGAFVPNAGPIGTFDVPPLSPDSFFDVFLDVPLADLPPSAETVLPGGGSGGATSSGQTSSLVACPPPNSWNGNVDMFWTGAGGTGNVNYHFGQLQVGPGAGPSCIHIIMDCEDPAGISWSISDLCPGWSATLVLDSGSFSPGGPAPNPIPPGFFDGWICVTADASVTSGSTCAPKLNLQCGDQPAVINVTSEACDLTPVPVDATSWGRIKVRFEK